MKAVKCPVCAGSGKRVSDGNPALVVDCHGCGGKGWVEIGVGDYPFTVPYLPYSPWPSLPPTVTYWSGGTTTSNPE